MDCARCYPWPWAIGYTALSALRHARNRVKAVALRATLQSIPVLPASEMMRSVRYPRARTLHCYTAWKPSGTVKEFIDFCLSSRGHALVQKAGYVVMSSTAPCPPVPYSFGVG
jgi:ABC-type phosphate transport system substrate-binding protein